MLTNPTVEQAGTQGINGHGTPPPAPPNEQRKSNKKEDNSRAYKLETDCYVHRLIVWTLAGVVAFALIGSLALTLFSTRPIPDMLLAFGSGALGALAGLLTPPPRRQGSDRPV